MGVEKHYSPEIETISEFLERFAVQNKDALGTAGDDSQKKAAILVNSLPTTVITDLQRRLKPKKLSEATYDEMKNHLEASYGVRKSTTGAAVTFLIRKQKASESIEAYSKILNEYASQANYKECCRDRLCKDIFISGLKSSKVMSTLITECEEKTFLQTLERAKLLEQVMLDVSEMHPASSTPHATSTNRVAKEEWNSRSNNDKASKQNDSNYKKRVPKNYKCIRCNSLNKHFQEDCFAINLRCNKCSQKGHIERACRSRQAQSSSSTKKTNRVHIEEEDATDYVAMHHIEESDRTTQQTGSSNNDIKSVGSHSHTADLRNARVDPNSFLA